MTPNYEEWMEMIESTGRWMTLKEAAAHLNFSPSYLYQRGDTVGIPRYKVGSKYRYKLSELEAWMQAQAQVRE